MPVRIATQTAIAMFALWVGAGTATGQTIIQPLPAAPGPYGSSPQTYSLPAPANQYPTGGSPYQLPGPPDIAQPGTNSSGPSFIYPDGGTSPPVSQPQAVGSGAMDTNQPLPTPGPSPTPIQEVEVQPQYSWYHYPWAWIGRDGWNSSIEFGLNGAEGNSNSISYAAGADVSRKTSMYNMTLNIDYRRTSTGGLETQNNARANLDFDRSIEGSSFATFFKTGLEYDQFKAFDARVNINGGYSYIFSKTDNFTFITRFGSGASQEIGAANDDWKPEAVFGLESNQQVNSRNRIFAKIDYFPAWEKFTDYRLVTDAGWEILLDDSENFSLKLSATNRYDSTPLGREPQDVDYAATLLYKF